MAFEHSVHSLFVAVSQEIICISALFIAAFLVGVGTCVFDFWVSRRDVSWNCVHFDPKGFSSNELHLLNCTNVKEAIVDEKTKVFLKGPCHLDTASKLSLPPSVLLPEPLVHVVPSQARPLKVLSILEFVDLSNLPLPNSDIPTSSACIPPPVPLPSTPTSHGTEKTSEAQKEKTEKTEEKAITGKAQEGVKTEETPVSQERTETQEKKVPRSCAPSTKEAQSGKGVFDTKEAVKPSPKKPPEAGKNSAALDSDSTMRSMEIFTYVG